MPKPTAPRPRSDADTNRNATSDAHARRESVEPSSATEESDVAQPAASPSGKRVNRAVSRPLETLEEFVLYAYSRNGQRLTLNKKAARTLAEAPSLSEEALTRIATLAQKDVLLAVPRQILLTGLQHRSVSKLWARLQCVVDRALETHPCTQGLLVRPAEPGNDELDIDSVVDAALRRDCAEIRGPRTGKPLTKAQMRTLRMNVAYTLGLWLVAKRGAQWPSVVRRLYSWVWEGEGNRVRTDTERLRAVTDIRQAGSAGLLCEAFVEEADEQRSRAEAARRREEKAQVRIGELEREVAAIEARLGAREERIEKLEEEMAETISKHDATVIHLRDDYERLRTRVLRRLRSELELLDEGLHAIRRTPPKVAVMEDHADRAVNGLRDEINALEAEARE